MVSLTAGPAVGQAAGYPNDAKKIGREPFYTQTDIGVGGTFTLLIGGALADYLVFSFGGTGGSLRAGDYDVDLGAVTFRTEVFPLWGLGGTWRELGIAADLGTGAANVTDDSGEKLVNGGLASRVGVAGFYEGIRLWKISMGPFAGVDYMFSDTIRRGEFVAGWRTALYVKP